MVSKEKLTSNLLASISGILIFISIEHFIDLNGYTSFAPAIIFIGVLLLMLTDQIVKLRKQSIITKPILLTLSHILIFLGSKVYLDQFIGDYWILYLMLGVILLNKHQAIANKIFNIN